MSTTLEVGARVMRGPLGREDRLADGPWLIARDLRDRRGVWVVALEGDPAVTVWAYPEQLSTVAPVNRWTMPDIADELDLRVETVHGYRSRKQMPEPTGIVGRTPYWTDAAIGPWIERQKARRKHKG